MFVSILSRCLIVGALTAATTLPTWAQVIDVEVNQAKVIKLSRPADTVIIGNPEIADASVQDATTIVLTGKGFGQTNLVVLAEDGSPVVDQQVSVSRNSASSIRVYRRAVIQTLHCSPFCENTYKSKAEEDSDRAMAAQ